MQKRQFIKLFTLLLIISFSSDSLAQEATVISKLNEVIRPIKTINPDSNFSDIEFLGGILKEKEVISLGEVTHGTNEVFIYKDRLIRYLVSNLNYRAIAFEADYFGLETIDNYITGKADTAAMSPNYRALFMWLRAFNKSQLAHNKVRVYGLELTEFSAAIDNILRQNQQISADDKQVLLRIKGMQFNKIDKASLKDFRFVCSGLPENLNRNMLLQLIDNYDNYIGRSAKIGARDKFMAENAIAIKAGTANDKLIIWAHNGHVAKTALYGNPAMGAYLHNKYKDKYYVIATDMNKGYVRVRKFIAKNKPISNWQSIYYPEVNSIKAYEYFFKACKFKNFILDLNEAKQDPELDAFLTQEKEMRLIGALSIPVNKKLSLANNFDMVIFFNETTSI